MKNSELEQLISVLQEKNKILEEREADFAEQKEELQSQREELTAAIEEVVRKNNYLTDTLEKLTVRNDELDQILYRISHELKSPLTSLEGLLLLFKPLEHSSEQKILYTYMNGTVKQMKEVLKSISMLGYSSFAKLDAVEIALKEFLQHLILDFRHLENFPYLQLDLVFNDIKAIRIDELVFHSILKCLLSNAILFRVPFQKGTIQVHFTKQGSDLCMEVTDDGDGIAPEIRGNIFKMFYRGSERSKGQGLGLYIVKILVERMNGTIDWKGEKGKTSFYVMLPGVVID